MSPPFVAKEKWSAIKNEREDDESLLEAEATAVAEIAAALQAQLDALPNTVVSGSLTVDALTALMMGALVASSSDLYDALVRLIAQGVTAGSQSVVSTLPVNFAIDWTLVNRSASLFVEDYSFNLVKDLNETSERGLRDALAKWIESGAELQDLANDLRPFFSDTAVARKLEMLFNIDRAELIATTEATRAYVEGKVIAYSEWGLADNPPEKKPPDDSHPGCRCDVGLDEDDDGSWHWVWYTARDERVCKICRPLNEKQVGLAKAAD